MSEEIIEEGNKTHEIAQVDTNHLSVRPRGQRRRVLSLNNAPSLTKQADKKRANIHNILNKYQKTGLLPQNTAKPLEGALPNVESYHDAMNALVETQQAFNDLPVKIREQFGNDPSQFLEFVNNPENIDTLREMGLASPEEGTQPVQVEVVATTASDNQTTTEATQAENQTSPAQ